MAEQKLNINQLDDTVLTETDHSAIDHTGIPGVGGGGGGGTDTVAGNNGITNVGDNTNAIVEPTYGNTANTITQGNDSRLPTLAEKAAMDNAPTPATAANPFLTAADGVGAGINTEDEGGAIGVATTLNFSGLGISAANVAGVTTVTVPGGVIATEDEGTALGATDTIDFVGGGITASHVSGKTTVTVPTPTSTVLTEDEGSSLGAADTLDFAGAGVSASFALGKTTITIPGGGGGSTSFDAVVDPSGSADFTTIGAAITAGAKLIRVLAGVYNESPTLTPGVFIFGPNGKGATAEDAVVVGNLEMVSNTGVTGMSISNGIVLVGAVSNVCIRNNFIGKIASGGAISQFPSALPLANIAIFGNIISTGPSTIGILLNNTTTMFDVCVQNNLINGFTVRAVDLVSPTTTDSGVSFIKNIVDCSLITTPNGDGVNIQSDNSIIKCNTIFGTGSIQARNGISCLGGGGIIADNIVHDFMGDGILMQHGPTDSPDTWTCTGNTINSCGGNGIHHTGSNNPSFNITGNTSRGNTGTGILLDAGTTNGICVANLSLGNTAAQLTDNGTTNLVANNKIV